MNIFHKLSPSKNQSKKKKRIGRGNAAGTGTYSGRGVKGQTARAGGKRRPGFEGGQTPLYRKMPKLKGFNNINRKEFRAVNIDALESTFDDKAKVNHETLVSAGLVRKGELVKVLGRGEIKKSLEVTVDKVSDSAKKAIEKAGGKVTELLNSTEKKEKSEEKADASE